MAPTFRHSARQSLKRAKNELAGNDPHRTRYAALELRDAMEALTYDRALAFKAEIPPEEYKTWQPRKLMMVLHAVDPTIAMTSSIAMGIEEEYGIGAPPEKMQSLGTDVVLTLDDLKNHYDAIGAGLHVPSLHQIEKGKAVDPVKFRARCEEVVGVIEKVLASPVWNATFGQFAHLDCMRCGTKLHKRFPAGMTEIDAQCFECKAEYVLQHAGDNKVHWLPKQVEIQCKTKGCDASMFVWADEVRPGQHFKCEACDQGYVIRLSYSPIKADQPQPEAA